MSFKTPLTDQQTQALLLVLSQAPDNELLEVREDIDSGRIKAHPQAFELLCAEVETRGLIG